MKEEIMQTKVEGFWLSPQQRLLWLLQASSKAFRSQCALLIQGELDAALLHLRDETVVARNEILRTTFHRPTGLKIPFQVVAEDLTEFDWKQLDLSHLSAAEQENGIEVLFEAESQHRFDFERAPLRVLLVQLSAQRHVLLMNLPALCADGQTLWNLTAEIARIYAAGGEEVASVNEPFQYVDFSEWQKELLEGEEGRAGKWYWHKQDFSALANLFLPLETKPAAEPIFETRCETGVISPEQFRRVEDVAHQYETAPAQVLLACWQTLLWRLTQRAEIIVGKLCYARGYEELINALGPFAKWLPIRCYFSDAARFDEILKQVSEACREVEDWQEFFIRERTSETGSTTLEPNFFPLGYEYEEWPAKLSAGDVSISLLKQYSCIEPFKVKLVCSRREGSLLLNFHYHSGLIKPQAVKCLARQFAALLECVLENPRAEISALEIIGEAERRQLIEVFNQTRHDYPQADLCLHQLFERQAAATPHATAVVYEDRRLSYSELNARANQLAHHLQKSGVGPEITVAICLERSVEMMVALLGTLKAGGTYVPLDPAYPKGRLAFMLRDAGASLLLTQRHLQEKLSEYPAPALCLDADWSNIEHESDANPATTVTPENTVYIIYTSGSTGQPKGVCIEHRQLVNYVCAVTERLDLPPQSSYATVSTFAADLGHTMIFPALCAGGTLHLISHERAGDPSALAAYFKEHRIDCLKVVPSHMEALLAWPNAAEIMPRLRLVLGGEASRWEIVRSLRNLVPDCSIYNHYGPTETTVGVITHCLDEGAEEDGSHMVPLGRPLPNASIYLLDKEQRPVPIGVEGELHIGGAGLGRGYLNQPDLTAERFIPNPFSATPGARLYRSGDLARYRSDEVLEFRGRIDNQVKFHGYRIELNEIRAALNQHAQIRDSVLNIARDQQDNAVLVAYYVSRQEIEVAELRATLLESIIEETIPNVFVHLKKLPLTLNGKINYEALPSLEEVRQMTRRSYVAPRTPAEVALASICASVLGLERVSIADNFFEMGGHSLLAIRFITQLRETFNVEVPLRTLFEKPTVADLALVITQIQLEQEDAEEMARMIEQLKDLSGDEIRQALNEELQLIEDITSE